MKERIDVLLHEWHEAGRADFEASYHNLNYDSCSPKVAREKSKYINLDEDHSGAFMLDKTDGNIYRIKSAYGVPNKRKLAGNIDTITGDVLNRLRWW
jgi:hypothetical protein